jgi:molybdopterin-binding protein
VPEAPAGERVRVVLGTRPMVGGGVSRGAVGWLGLRGGLPVFATFKATGVTVYA